MPTRQRVVWLDTIRLAAFILLVACHCTDPFNFYPGTSPDLAQIKLWGEIYGAFVRPCVPLFVMITGALLLPVRQLMVPFYKRRISRVVWPFLIWSVLYNLFLPVDIDLGSYAIHDEGLQSNFIGGIVRYVGVILFNFTGRTTHMWYIYMLIGLYLYMPIFSCWVEQASRQAQRGFLLLWGVTLFVPYLLEFFTAGLWGTCSWNEFGMLYYFAGFNGYLLLGHYLRETPEWSLRKTLVVCVPMFVIGYAICFSGYRWMCLQPGITSRQYELFLYYNSFQVMLMSVATFQLVRKVRVRAGSRVQRLLANLTACGFGIYMCHYFFIAPSVELVRSIGIPIPLQILCATPIAFIGAWVLVILLRKMIRSERLRRIFLG